jgi:predicted nucleic acid-binding protein
MTKKRLPRDITNTPAPWLPGLYSMQAVGKRGLPDVTVYRQNVEDVLAWKVKESARGVFSKFLLRHAADAWDVYEEDGKLECLCSDVVGRKIPESQVGTLANCELLEAEAVSVVGSHAARIVHAESHAYASVVDHSNYGWVLRNMIRDASEKDLRHIYVVESHTYDRRVAGVYADVTGLSAKAQNQFLDAYHALTTRTPLDKEDYVRLFMGRTAALRVDYLSDVCARAGEISGLDEEEILSIRLSVGCRGEEFRRELVSKLLNLTGSRISTSVAGAAEKLDEEALKDVASEVVATFCLV